MEDDLKYRPEWEPYVPRFRILGGSSKAENLMVASEIGRDIADQDISNCPFASFFH